MSKITRLTEIEILKQLGILQLRTGLLIRIFAQLVSAWLKFLFVENICVEISASVLLIVAV